MRHATKTSTVLFLAMGVAADSAELPGRDVWLTNAPALPPEFASGSPSTVPFSTARAEAIAGRFRVSWDSPSPFEITRVVASADFPGHWPARDWRSAEMHRHGNEWQAELPVDSLDVPVVYFLVGSHGGQVIASAMRIAWPRALGLEQPTRLFWPFIEGFEQGLQGWRALHGPPLRLTSPAKHGRSALAVQIPREQRSVTVATTRLRGWFLQEHRASGIELWLRTRDGEGAAAFELLANAFSTNQVMARRAETQRVTPQWARVELRLSQFGRFPIGDLDLVSIELTGSPGTEFLIDDVQLLGRWPGL